MPPTEVGGVVDFWEHCDLDWSIWVAFGLVERGHLGGVWLLSRGHLGGVFSGFWGMGWRFLDKVGASYLDNWAGVYGWFVGVSGDMGWPFFMGDIVGVLRCVTRGRGRC